MSSKKALTLMSKIESLPPEVIQDILTRLPIDSISESRYVCHSWYKFIKDRHFAIMHYRKSLKNPNPASIIIFPLSERNFIYIPNLDACEKAVKLKNSPLLDNHWFRVCTIVGSVNGLICLACKPNVFVILNPLTGDWIKLPDAKKNDYYWCAVFCGFAYDSKNNNEYKLIRMHPLSNTSKPRILKVEVLTLGSKSWRSIGTTTSHIDVWDNNGVFFNGCLHWIDIDCGNVFISAFNVEDENFKVIPTNFGKKIYHSLNLGVLGDCLMITHRVHDRVEIWVMKEYGVKESWIVEHIIPKNDHHAWQILGVQKNGNLLIICTDSALYSFDPKTSTHKKVEVPGLRFGFRPVCHFGSLVSPKNVIVKDEEEH